MATDHRTQGEGKDSRIKNVLEPITFNNLTMMDTGAGWNGTLSIMNVESKEFWISKIQKPPGDKK